MNARRHLSDTRIRHLLAALVWGAAPLLAQVAPDAKTIHQVSLAPGEGTILCLGTEEDFAALKQSYFTPVAAAQETDAARGAVRPFRLDFMPMGFYLGDKASYQNAATAMGVDVWTYLGRLLDKLKAAGTNTIYLQGGSLTAPELSRFVHARGFKVILQMDDLYFRGTDYFKGSVKGPWAPYAGPREYFEGSLKPRLEKLLPLLEQEPAVWACSPVEELPADSEPAFTPYKELVRRLAPRPVHFQLDSQQATTALLASKQPPYPDLFGFDRYPWWSQPGNNHAKHGDSLYLWTPHFSARWLYNAMKTYADGVHQLYKADSLAVLQGPATINFYSREDGRKYGWKEDAGFIPPTAPHIRWHPERQLWGGWTSYFPPPGAERLQSWLAVCAGMKGVLMWAAVFDKSEEVRARFDGSKPPLAPEFFSTTETWDKYAGIVRPDLSTAPQWDELVAAWQGIQPMGKLILGLRPSAEAYATATGDPDLFVNSFTDAAGRRFVVVVNGRIGQWDGNNPVWLDYPNTKLSVGADGNLTHFTPLREPRACGITLAGGWKVMDARGLAPRPGQ